MSAKGNINEEISDYEKLRLKNIEEKNGRKTWALENEAAYKIPSKSKLRDIDIFSQHDLTKTGRVSNKSTLNLPKNGNKSTEKGVRTARFVPDEMRSDKMYAKLSQNLKENYKSSKENRPGSKIPPKMAGLFKNAKKSSKSCERNVKTKQIVQDSTSAGLKNPKINERNSSKMADQFKNAKKLSKYCDRNVKPNQIVQDHQSPTISQNFKNLERKTNPPKTVSKKITKNPNDLPGKKDANPVQSIQNKVYKNMVQEIYSRRPSLMQKPCQSKSVNQTSNISKELVKNLKLIAANDAVLQDSAQQVGRKASQNAIPVFFKFQDIKFTKYMSLAGSLADEKPTKKYNPVYGEFRLKSVPLNCTVSSEIPGDLVPRKSSGILNPQIPRKEFQDSSIPRIPGNAIQSRSKLNEESLIPRPSSSRFLNREKPTKQSRMVWPSKTPKNMAEIIPALPLKVKNVKTKNRQYNVK